MWNFCQPFTTYKLNILYYYDDLPLYLDVNRVGSREFSSTPPACPWLLGFWTVVVLVNALHCIYNDNLSDKAASGNRVSMGCC